MSSGVPLLGASIIVKDEQDHLRRCLISLQGLCDEVVVVDTGSSDNTIDVALEFGARVLERPWNGDFAAARNFALGAMTSTWVMYVDADEEVVEPDVQAVRSLLTLSTSVAAFGIRVIGQHGWTPYIDYRIWRHKHEIQFRGEIHETTLPDIRSLAAEQGETLSLLNLTLQHHGYEGDLSEKHLRNLPLLLHQLAATPRRVHIWNHLGRVHAGLGQTEEAEAAWLKGREIVLEDGVKEITDVFVFASLADFFTKTRRDASFLLDEGLHINGSYMTLKWLRAQNFFMLGSFREALIPLHELTSYSIESNPISSFAYNKSMFSTWSLSLMGDCLFELAEYEQAADAFERAMTAGADRLAMRAKSIACRMLSSEKYRD